MYDLPGDAMPWAGGLIVVGSLQLGGSARFISRPHVATLMFI